MKSRHLILCILAPLLAACSHTQYKLANARVRDTQHEIQHDLAHYDKTAPTVVKHSGYYVSTTPYSLAQQPKWMRQQITLQAQNLPFNILMNRILAGSDMTV
ncbi:MAG: hypothetical protein COB66_09535, partial [Coxiella sp. (in: Bacteria)]